MGPWLIHAVLQELQAQAVLQVLPPVLAALQLLCPAAQRVLQQGRGPLRDEQLCYGRAAGRAAVLAGQLTGLATAAEAGCLR